ncbi:HAD family phosphatase [Candidatus Desantisbacteria bacterium]|nr:HAD family phosphatase [Candidatus Desantisbacteria bacterium]
MIKAIIFDMDGLMVDTESLYSIALQKIAQKRGKDFTLELKRAMIGRQGRVSMNIFREHLGLTESAEELLIEREDVYGELLNEAELVPMPGLLELLLLTCTMAIPMAIASSSSECWIRIVIDKLGIADRFKAIVSGNNVENGKPCPDVYLLAAKKLGILPQYCLALEDTPTGMEAAKRAGMICVAVPNQYSEGLDFSMADMVINSLKDVEDEVLKKYEV